MSLAQFLASILLITVVIGIVIGFVMNRIFLRADITQGRWKKSYLRITFPIAYFNLLSAFLLVVLFVFFCIYDLFINLGGWNPFLSELFYSIWKISLLVAYGHALTTFMHYIGYHRVLRSHRHSRKLKSMQYEPWGILWFWSRATRNYNKKIEWLPRIFPELLNQLQTVPNESHIQIVSVSANVGEYERSIAKRLYDHELPSHLLASDYDGTEEYRIPKNDPPNFHYAKKAYDAKNIQELLRDQGLKQVDCIIDFKGSLWHTIEGAKRGHKKRELESLMMAFHSVLKTEGFIVVEAYSRKPIRIFLNNVTCKLIGKIWSYAESSSDFMIQPFFEKSTALQTAFTRTVVGEGMYQLAIYRKRELEEVQAIAG